MKTDWERSTRVCDYTQFRPELRIAIEAKLKEMDEDLDILFCIETESRKLTSSLFFGKKGTIQHMAALLTRKWLIQAFDTTDGKTDPYAIFHYLDKMEVSQTTMEMARKLKFDEFGVDVLSTIHGTVQRGSLFIGLEKNAAAEQFITALKDAVREANP